MFVYAAFLAWDSLAARLQRGRKLTIVYDDNCAFCMRVLLLVKDCDIAGGLRFLGSSDPGVPRGHDYTSAMFVFDQNGHACRGYDGFVHLFSYIGLTKPFAWFVSLAPVACVGRKIYSWFARSRSCLSGSCRTGNGQRGI
jgi:predicted DCC family thiol-disulfide oxidoreductase YuxK